jgi:hypothetical protein
MEISNENEIADIIKSYQIKDETANKIKDFIHYHSKVFLNYHF